MTIVKWSFVTWLWLITTTVLADDETEKLSSQVTEYDKQINASKETLNKLLEFLRVEGPDLRKKAHLQSKEKKSMAKALSAGLQAEQNDRDAVRTETKEVEEMDKQTAKLEKDAAELETKVEGNEEKLNDMRAEKQKARAAQQQENDERSEAAENTEAEITEQLTEVDKNIEKSDEERKQISSQMSKMDVEAKESVRQNQEAVEKEEDAQSLMAQNEANKAANAEKAEANKTKKEKADNLQAQADATKAETDTEKTAHVEEVGKQKAEQQGENGVIEALKEKLQYAKDKQLKTETEAETIAKKAIAMEAKTKEAQELFAKLQEESEKLQKEFTKEDTENKDLNAKLESTSMKNKEYERQANTEQTTLDAKQEEVTKIDEQVSQMNDEIELNKQHMEIQTSKAKLAETEARIQAQSQVLQDLVAEVGNQKSQDTNSQFMNDLWQRILEQTSQAEVDQLRQQRKALFDAMYPNMIARAEKKKAKGEKFFDVYFRSLTCRVVSKKFVNDYGGQQSIEQTVEVGSESASAGEGSGRLYIGTSPGSKAKVQMMEVPCKNEVHRGGTSEQNSAKDQVLRPGKPCKDQVHRPAEPCKDSLLRPNLTDDDNTESAGGGKYVTTSVEVSSVKVNAPGNGTPNTGTSGNGKYASTSVEVSSVKGAYATPSDGTLSSGISGNEGSGNGTSGYGGSGSSKTNPIEIQLTIGNTDPDQITGDDNQAGVPCENPKTKTELQKRITPKYGQKYARSNSLGEERKLNVKKRPYGGLLAV